MSLQAVAIAGSTGIPSAVLARKVSSLRRLRGHCSGGQSLRRAFVLGCPSHSHSFRCCAQAPHVTSERNESDVTGSRSSGECGRFDLND